MSIRRTLGTLWQSLFRTSRLDRELDEELRGYLDDLIERKSVPAQTGRQRAAPR